MLLSSQELLLFGMVYIGVRLFQHKIGHDLGEPESPFWILDSAIHYAYSILRPLNLIVVGVWYCIVERIDGLRGEDDTYDHLFVEEVQGLRGHIDGYDVSVQVQRKNAVMFELQHRYMAKMNREMEEMEAFLAAEKELRETIAQGQAEITATKSRIAILEAEIAQLINTSGQDSGHSL